jgi:hypothetical protein
MRTHLSHSSTHAPRREHARPAGVINLALAGTARYRRRLGFDLALVMTREPGHPRCDSRSARRGRTRCGQTCSSRANNEPRGESSIFTIASSYRGCPSLSPDTCARPGVGGTWLEHVPLTPAPPPRITRGEVKARTVARSLLVEYRRKRKFGPTPEPWGNGAERSGEPIFVVQKHAATGCTTTFDCRSTGFSNRGPFQKVRR